MNKSSVLLCVAAAMLTACSDNRQPSENDSTNDDVNVGQRTGPISTEPLENYCNFPSAAPKPGSSQTDFDTYSWKMFVSLNWVVSANQRGEPDCTKPFAATGSRVWESWKTTDQVFLPNAQNPGTWNSGWGSPLKLSLSATSKASPQAQSNLQGTSQESAILQPVGGWLIDQRGNPTYYQIASNELSYNYIVQNGLYDATIVKTFHPVDFPWQAAEIKASWRILTSADDFGRYLTMSANVEQYDSQGQPFSPPRFKAETLGLVGLHIINKAPGYAQWIWATFEQVDNVTPPVIGNQSHFAPYYDASAKNPNQSPCLNRASPCQPIPPATFSTPDPLTRLTPIAANTAQVNATFQALFSDNFARYYQLITTQRPNDPNDPGNPLGTPTPNIAANVTMESYIQPTSSCMACHQLASGVGSNFRSDFSFLLLHAQQPPTSAQSATGH